MYDLRPIGSAKAVFRGRCPLLRDAVAGGLTAGRLVGSGRRLMYDLRPIGSAKAVFRGRCPLLRDAVVGGLTAGRLVGSGKRLTPVARW